MLHLPLARRKKLIQSGMAKRGISTTEAARYLNISQSSLYTLMQCGQLPSQRVNGRRVISRGALMEYQARKKPMNYW